MLSNIKSSATTEAATTEAAQRPFAVPGAGAVTLEGTRVSFAGRTAAAPRLPRIKRDTTVCSPAHAQAGLADGGAYRISLSQTSPVLADAGQASTMPVYTQQNFNQMTRIPPVTPGGLGPHPARAPDPA